MGADDLYEDLLLHLLVSCAMILRDMTSWRDPLYRAAIRTLNRSGFRKHYPVPHYRRRPYRAALHVSSRLVFPGCLYEPRNAPPLPPSFLTPILTLSLPLGRCFWT